MVEVTLALVLLAGAGVLVRSSRAAFQVDLGFDAEHLTRLSLLSGKSGWASAEEMERYYTAVRERLATVPGVEAAAVVHAPPIANTGWVMATFPESEPPEGGKLPPLAWWRPVSPHYFQTAGIRLLADRGFGDEDRLAAEPVVVLNETLARAYLPPGASLDEALSATWRITFEGEERMRVVGVVGDVRILGPRQQAPRIAYRPLAQASQTLFRYGITDARSFLVRSHLPPAALAAPLRAAALAEDRLASVLQLESMSRTLRTSQARSTAVTTLLTSFALTALLLGAVGIYGVMSHAVGERRREMGIRLALGARPAAVLGAVLRDGLGLVLAGLSLGALCALGATRLLQSELFTVAPNDPTSLLTAGTVLLLSGTIAVLVPARRGKPGRPHRGTAQRLRGAAHGCGASTSDAWPSSDEGYSRQPPVVVARLRAIPVTRPWAARDGRPLRHGWPTIPRCLATRSKGCAQRSRPLRDGDTTGRSLTSPSCRRTRTHPRTTAPADR